MWDFLISNNTNNFILTDHNNLWLLLLVYCTITHSEYLQILELNLDNSRGKLAKIWKKTAILLTRAPLANWLTFRELVKKWNSPY